jgi:hypothetical protein
LHSPPTRARPPARSLARSDCARKGVFMLPSVWLASSQSQPPRQPSEAAYGSSGRAREVGAILRCVLTSRYAIAARPHQLVRREHAPYSRRDTAAAAGRCGYMPTNRQTHPLKYRSHDMSVCHEKRHRDRERERLRSVRRNKWGRNTLAATRQVTSVRGWQRARAQRPSLDPINNLQRDHAVNNLQRDGVE